MTDSTASMEARGTEPLAVAIFPSASNIPLYYALQRGRFENAGIQVAVTEVQSSGEQLSGWDAGRFSVLHTSPDHLLRSARPREPAIARIGGVGELSVYASRDPAAECRWAVDDPRSAFALVLRAVLEDVASVHVTEERLVQIGGTKQRFEALIAGDAGVDGTTLHPPFDALADELGIARIGGHLAVEPDLYTDVTVVPRSEIETPSVQSYLQILDVCVAELLAGGPAAIAAGLAERGFDARTAYCCAEALIGPSGLGAERTPQLKGLEAVARLRQRFDAGWEPHCPLEDLLVEEQGATTTDG